MTRHHPACCAVCLESRSVSAACAPPPRRTRSAERPVVDESAPHAHPRTRTDAHTATAATTRSLAPRPARASRAHPLQRPVDARGAHPDRVADPLQRPSSSAQLGDGLIALHRTELVAAIQSTSDGCLSCDGKGCIAFRTLAGVRSDRCGVRCPGHGSCAADRGTPTIFRLCQKRWLLLPQMRVLDGVTHAPETLQHNRSRASWVGRQTETCPADPGLRPQDPLTLS